jgi:DNA transposition AAA+ family ATPase
VTEPTRLVDERRHTERRATERRGARRRARGHDRRAVASENDEAPGHEARALHPGARGLAAAIATNSEVHMETIATVQHAPAEGGFVAADVPLQQGESLQQALHELLEQDATLTQARIAKECALSGTVLSQWLRGRYPGDVRGVETKVLTWLRARGERRRASAALPTPPEFFRGPTADTIWAALGYAQTAGAMAQVVTVPGCGKTTVARVYRAQSPNVWLVTMSPTCAGIVPALEEICETLGMRPEGGARRMERAIRKRVSETRGLIVIDEAQHLSIPALDAIRSIHDATDVGIALLGNEVLAARIAGGRRADSTAQLSSRIGYRRIIRRPHAKDAAAQLDAWRVEGRAEREYLTEIACRPGGLRSVTKVLQLASVAASSAGDRLSRRHLEHAWRQLGAVE